MNHIQLLSREIEMDRLKLQMGLDRAVDIDYPTLRAMWRELHAEQLRARLGADFLSHGYDPLPDDPAAVDFHQL